MDALSKIFDDIHLNKSEFIKIAAQWEKGYLEFDIKSENKFDLYEWFKIQDFKLGLINLFDKVREFCVEFQY